MHSPPIRRARDVAELRSWLVRELAPEGRLGYVLNKVLVQARSVGMHSPTDRRAEQRRLKEASLYYVPAASVDALEEAAKAVPVDLTLHPWQMPTEHGFAVLERPIVGLDADSPGGVVMVHALLWGPVDVVDEDSGSVVNCLGISCWHLRSDDSPRDQWTGDFENAWWVPLGRSDWVWNTAVNEYPPVYERMGNNIKDSASEDRRYAAALWGLALAVSAPEIERADRAVVRRAQRQGISAPPNVRVVAIPIHSGEHGAPTGRHQHVRYMVKGHWRNQACGPKRQEHRYIYIAAHWRGPEDAPLSTPATVVKKLRG